MDIQSFIPYDTFLPILLLFIAIYLAYSSWLTRCQRHLVNGMEGMDPPMIPARLPFGLDILYYAIKMNRTGRSIEVWRWFMNKSQSMTWRLNIMGKTSILSVDPENIKHVLATKFDNFVKGPDFHSRFYEFLGDGIFNADGQIWKTQRALIKPYFSQNRITDIELFDKHYRKMDNILKNSSEIIDMQDMWARFTLDSATDFLFGYNVDSLSNQTSEFASAFNYAQEHMAMRGRLGNIWRYVLPKKKFTQVMKYIHGFMQPFVDRALEKHQSQMNENSISDTLLDSLVQYTKDPILLRDAILNILLAGRDTTASLLTWAIYELSARQDIVQRLLDEFDSIGIDDGPITYTQIKECRFLKAVINETLRMYPSVPFEVRSSVKEDILPSGHYIPANTTFVYSALLMQRSPELWGPNAGIWDPDRWNMKDGLPSYVTNAFSYLPFNGGPRICLGQRFAIIEASLCLIRFIRNWKFELASSNLVMMKFAIILTSKNGMPMKLTPRKSPRN